MVPIDQILIQNYTTPPDTYIGKIAYSLDQIDNHEDRVGTLFQKYQ